MFNKNELMWRSAKLGMHFSRLSITCLLLALSLGAIGGCAPGPDFKIPESPKTDTYTEEPLPSSTVGVKTKKESLGKVQRFALDKDIPGDWWRVFHSKSLNKLIEVGLQNSPTVEAAEAALRKSEETVNAYRGTLLPAVTGGLSAERQQLSAAQLRGATASRNFSLYNASVNVSYNLDIFGARRKIEAYCAELEYKRFLLEATYLTLASNIVTTAIAEASSRAQIEATQDIIRSTEKALDIIQKQFTMGGINKVDVLAQETQLARVRATLPPLEKQLSVARHSLAMLIGKLPSDKQIPSFRLTDLNLTAELPVSMPSLLTQQRPDIRASEAVLHQASAKIGIATANLFPQITLSGNYGAKANKLGDLFESLNSVWLYGGQLVQPIVAGGTLRAERRAAVAAYEEAAAQYRETVLKAFQNVADTLRAIEFDAKQLAFAIKAEKVAKDTLTLSQSQLKLGSVNYLSLLNAQRQYQQTRLIRIQAEAARFADTAALFQALGGGWWNRDCDGAKKKKEREFKP